VISLWASSWSTRSRGLARRMAMSQQKAISATVTGDDQEVGFRAMVMKQAIEYNLAGAARNEPNMIVRFTLHGDGKRIAMAACGRPPACYSRIKALAPAA
jgi:hypothetical protein